MYFDDVFFWQKYFGHMQFESGGFVEAKPRFAILSRRRREFSRREFSRCEFSLASS